MIRFKRSDRLLDLGILTLLLLLPLLLYAPVTLGSKTLLPVDYLFLDQPFRADADDLGIDYPHNHLVADLILENYVWKKFFLYAILLNAIAITLSFLKNNLKPIAYRRK